MGSGTVGISHVWQLPWVSMLVFCFMYLNTGVNEWKTSQESVNHIAVCLCVIFWSVKHIAEWLCEWRISRSKCYIIINYLGSCQVVSEPCSCNHGWGYSCSKINQIFGQVKRGLSSWELEIISTSWFFQSTSGKLISLELFDSRPLYLHLLDLVCIVYITFCRSFCVLSYFQVLVEF
jgi:hypothetical protein